MTLVATDLRVRYPGADAPALDGVSLRVARGELVLLAGPNGSGKSTLFASLSGLRRPDAGTIAIEGRALASWSRRALAQAVGALPQREEQWFPLRVEEAVLLGRWSRLGPFAAASDADHAAVRTAMERTDVLRFVGRSTDTLSGGEWQRVRLARALAAEPRYLLLDEPTTALDLAHEMALLELLRQLVDTGLGVLAITHHLNAAAQYADQVVLLDRGAAAASGPPPSVLTAEHLTRVFRWPVAVTPGPSGAPHVTPLRPDTPTS